MKNIKIKKTVYIVLVILGLFIFQTFASKLGGFIADLFQYAVIDKDGTFMSISVHHIIQMIVALVLIHVISKKSDIEFWLKPRLNKSGILYTTIFSIVILIYVLISYVVGYSLNTIELYAYELNISNVLGTLQQMIELWQIRMELWNYPDGDFVYFNGIISTVSYDEWDEFQPVNARCIENCKEVFINTDVELDIFEDAFRSAIERNVRIIVFSFVTSHSAISEVEIYSHERERRPENTDSRIMIVADEKLVMIADADNARGNWSGTVSNNKLMKDVVREHIHNDIYMLKLRNIFGKEIYEKIHLNTSQEAKSCQEVKK